MAMSDQEKIDKFTHSKIDDDFGLTIDEIANKVGNAGRFGVWLNGDKSKIKKVLQAVKDQGVSPAFFAAYEVNEGYTSPWGWLNHTNALGDYLTDAKSVAQKVLSQSKDMSGSPAWADSFNSPWTPPQDVINKGNKDFNENMGKGTIGRAYIPLTAAATWAAYYPKGLNASVNGVGNYGNPFLDAANTILAWGGNLDGKKGSGSSGSEGGKDDSNNNGSIFDDLIDNLPDNPLETAKKVYQAIMDYLEELTQWDMHSIGTDKHFANKYFRIMKTYNNTYKLKLNLSFYDELKDVFSGLGNDADGSEKDDKDKDKDNGSNDDSKYNTCYILNKPLWFRYAKTQADLPAGYPFPSANGHHGSDYGFINEPLKSPVSGTVTGNNGHGFTVNDGGIGYDGDGTGWGNRIVIKLDDGSGRSMLFAHLSQFKVKSGDKVKVGQTIAITGNTGEMTSGAHLHVELKDTKHPNSANDGTIDPTDFLKKHCKK